MLNYVGLISMDEYDDGMTRDVEVHFIIKIYKFVEILKHLS